MFGEINLAEQTAAAGIVKRFFSTLRVNKNGIYLA